MQFIIAILDCVPNYTERTAVIWAQCSMMIVWNLMYNLSIGPVCFVILCECSATKVRSKTIAVATAVQAAFGIVMTVAIPYMINPDAGNMRGKVGFFYGVSLLSLLVGWKEPVFCMLNQLICSRHLLRCVFSGRTLGSRKPAVGRTKSWISCSTRM